MGTRDPFRRQDDAVERICGARRGLSGREIGRQLWPVASEPAFQAIDKLQVALLVEIHDGQRCLELAAFWNLFRQSSRQPVGV